MIIELSLRILNAFNFVNLTMLHCKNWLKKFFKIETVYRWLKKLPNLRFPSDVICTNVFINQWDPMLSIF